jgi:hypothetical protein
LICCLPIVAYGLDVPKLQGYVNDYAGMISSSAKSKIEEELRAFEQSDSTQIVILTIPSLEGENIEEFSIKVAEDWKIGQQQKDNGILLIVSKQRKKIRTNRTKNIKTTLGRRRLIAERLDILLIFECLSRSNTAHQRQGLGAHYHLAGSDRRSLGIRLGAYIYHVDAAWSSRWVRFGSDMSEL